MDFLKLTYDKLNVSDISDLVTDGSCGAISLFVGTTRDNFEDKKVLTLEYEAYEPMALKEMKKICDAVRDEWPDIVKIAIYHRLGMVSVCEASVAIAISSPHRKSSLAAVSFAIDELKKSVPIWKKEIYNDDESAWKENKECAWVENETSSSRKRMKRPTIDFSSCSIEEQSIPQNLVQIAADEGEIKRRIHCFVEKKREEIDMNNILDYTEIKPPIGHEIKEETSTCARTNSVVVKQDDSKCHLRVRRVKNRVGPQVKTDYLHTLDKLMSASSDDAGISQNNLNDQKIKQEPNSTHEEVKKLPIGLRERLLNIEQHLKLENMDYKHIYDRIKAMEDKILYLESISPEYKHFLMVKPQLASHDIDASVTPTPVTYRRRTFTADELDVLITQLQGDNSVEQEDNKMKILKTEPMPG